MVAITYQMNQLRNRALLLIRKELKSSTKRHCERVEQLAWDQGEEKYPLIIRRILAGQSITQAIIEMEPMDRRKEKEIVAEGDLQCGKCKSKRIHRIEKQTRSADESATVFCCCSECGNRWKF